MSREEIADLLDRHNERLTEEWMRAVRVDPRNQSSGALTRPELADHAPAIIEEICGLIRSGELPDLNNTFEARAGVYLRFHQGYRGRDLVRELSLLRILLLDYEMKVWRGRAPNLPAHIEASRIINLYIDEELRLAISVFAGTAPPAPNSSPPPE
jgi:hypothetical protein